jgi:hypothetical protein
VRSNQRVWATLRPLCLEAIGNEAAVDALGANHCARVVQNVANVADPESTRAAIRAVADTRAGERPPPEPGVTQHPVFELFWALTGESPALEADLAQSLGPEDAKRIVYAKGMCSHTSSYSVGR